MDVQRYQVPAGSEVRLAEWASDEPDGDKDDARAELDELATRLADLQQLLYAQHDHRVLLILQGMDTSGKDGTIRKVFREVGPLGVDVANFKKPSDDDLAHDYLWRVHQHSPRAGHITVFNRSHYEEVLVVRVHGLVEPDRLDRRYGHLRDFERMLADEGVTIVKCFLHISKETQRERLQERVDDPHKQWKFNHGDLAERERWDDYQAAYERALSETSTEWAPWHIIPSDRTWYRNVTVAQLLVDTLERLDMQWPAPDKPVDGLVVE